MGHGFEVKINDEQPIRAGLGAENYVVTCILNAVLRRDSFEEELDITISGLDSVDDVLRWFRKAAHIFAQHDAK